MTDNFYRSSRGFVLSSAYCIPKSYVTRKQSDARITFKCFSDRGNSYLIKKPLHIATRCFKLSHHFEFSNLYHITAVASIRPSVVDFICHLSEYMDAVLRSKQKKSHFFQNVFQGLMGQGSRILRNLNRSIGFKSIGNFTKLNANAFFVESYE